MIAVQAIKLLSPAKLNLFLHVLGRRDDGYHNLHTYFQLLDYGDEMLFEQAAGIAISPELLGVPLEQNLIYKAAVLLQQTISSNGAMPGVKIQLTKHLPMGGGIGGGSSNAATTLLALNKLWQLGLSIGQLAEIGQRLGADVPVFVRGYSGFAQGVGEQIQPYALAPQSYVVIKPDCEVSTMKIFQHFQLTRNSDPLKIRAFFQGGRQNDCQPLVRRLYPEVDFALSWLNDRLAGRMTGTGSCIFACCENQAQGEEILSQLPASLTGFVATGVNRSTVHQQLNI